jgi:amidase
MVKLSVGTNMTNDICFMSAREMAAQIAARKISAREVMQAHLAQIARVNPKVNAIVAKLDDAKSLELADEADKKLASKQLIGPLHGLPIAHKDLEAAVGFPWTRGSLIYKNDMPTEDSGLVARLRGAGALTIGKTNTPEFGMGSHTYNKVYGITRNAYDQSKSAGGSSGGAAVALATGMLPIADGSDFGGSLRNPGNFNNIVGFRPSVGLVTTAPTDVPFLGYSVKGPMARTVSDVAFLLSIVAGPDAHDPGTFPGDPTIFAKPLTRNFKGTRVAWCPDLGGVPMDSRVTAVLNGQRKAFENLGCIVEDACPPGIAQSDEIFLTIRRWRSWARYGALLKEHRAELKPEAIEEIELGAKVTADQISRAMAGQAALMQRMATFQQKYPFLLCAVNQVPPFDAEIDWPHEVGGVKMTHYVEWMKTAYWISTTFCPALSVPAGFTPEGLPVGIQIVGHFRDDWSVLQLGHAFEQATKLGAKRPPIATA